MFPKRENKDDARNKFMDVEASKNIAAAIAIGMESIGRNPEATPKIQANMILAIAFAEAVAIYALVMALIIKFI